MLTDPASYRIRVMGQVGAEWSEWFGGVTITWDETNETTLFGQVLDQAALCPARSSEQLGAEKVSHIMSDHGERYRVALEYLLKEREVST